MPAQIVTKVIFTRALHLFYVSWTLGEPQEYTYKACTVFFSTLLAIFELGRLYYYVVSDI